eukprot:TRINITY_DN18628_c0_g1_i1.p1 TRINITY_DN18628_c0_g1~~TRINITY_DN18628_c0_g1_i1.p1  ORF type:complete len:646 (-),score=94.66 TRINITY_DN18628_c0_g1_i1:15-1709(-)
MEGILQACGAFHGGGLDIATERKVESLRGFRDTVLDTLRFDPGFDELDAGSGTLLVLDLRRLCERLRSDAKLTKAEEVAEYWEERLAGLPPKEEDCVTGDEIGSALLAWLEDLLTEALGVSLGGAERDLELESNFDHPMDGQAPGFSDDDFAHFSHEAWGNSPGFADGGSARSTGRGAGSPGTGAAGGRGGGAASAGRRLPVPPPGRTPGARGGHASGATQAAPRSQKAPYALSGMMSPGSPWSNGGGPEDQYFGDFMSKRLGVDAEAECLPFMELYRAVRDVVEDEDGLTPDAGGTPRRNSRGGFRPPAVRAGASCLTAILCRRMRETMRHLEASGRAASGGAKGSSAAGGAAGGARGRGDNDLLPALISSQARAAEVLERRAVIAPVTWKIAWILGRASRRTCIEVWECLRFYDPHAPAAPALPAALPAPPTGLRGGAVAGSASPPSSGTTAGRRADHAGSDFFPEDPPRPLTRATSAALPSRPGFSPAVRGAAGDRDRDRGERSPTGPGGASAASPAGRRIGASGPRSPTSPGTPSSRDAPPAYPHALTRRAPARAPGRSL